MYIIRRHVSIIFVSSYCPEISTFPLVRQIKVVRNVYSLDSGSMELNRFTISNNLELDLGDIFINYYLD